jgi:3-oxoacyl-[acyl-carrier-protein] synthase II
MRRVVVTGLGVVSPLGVGADTLWCALTRGVSGIRRISRFDSSPFASQIAGEVPDFDPLAYLPRRDVVRTDPFIQYALVAAYQAIADAKLQIEGQNERVGVMVGNSMGGIGLLMTAHDTLRQEGPGAISPYAMPGFLPTMAAGWVAMRTGARGPIGSPTTACAAGNQAIGEAFRAIQHGDADAMLAGGTDALVQPIVLGCFCALRALSTRNDDPQAASRPFDRDRDGFVMAEGAGILVLEEYEAARARGKHIYAEVVGYAVTADANHPTMPSTDGPAQAMRLALADARLHPEDVDYVNAHGTSTPRNDANETSAIKRAFGPHAARLAVSSTKSMVGHLNAAAGAVESIATVLAIQHQLAPPTINHRTPDPECDLDYVPNVARRMQIRAALSNSFAFGGVNAILAFRQVV